ncbi:tail protein [Stenotrophomonas phage BUCTxx99]|nr:tail protein [Stenotrophomonas phage BUCTxx99]
MATETFTWERQAGAQGKISWRVIEAKFGDGYSQTISDGLNVESQTWPLTFEGGINYVKPIIEFFRRHKGSKSFYWTPPGSDSALLFRADQVTFTSIGGGVYSVSAEFKQVFYQ